VQVDKISRRGGGRKSLKTVSRPPAEHCKLKGGQPGEPGY
jgi:hypothetical protein